MILAAGLTPAWQQIISLDGLVAGEVNRARQVSWCASGKVLNVAVALKSLGASPLAIAPLGRNARAAIDAEFESLGIDRRWIDVQCPTRVCTTVLESASGQVTELVENAGALSQTELAQFAAAVAREAPSAEALVFTGSLPQGTPPTIVRDILRTVSCPVVLDVRGPELLDALACRPLVVKPNLDELLASVDATARDERSVRHAMHSLLARGARWVVMSQGSGPVWIAGVEGDFRILPPKVSVINTIGSGDCLAAGIAWGLALGEEPIRAICWGIGAAVENVGHMLPARLDAARVSRLAKSLSVDYV